MNHKYRNLTLSELKEMLLEKLHESTTALHHHLEVNDFDGVMESCSDCIRMAKLIKDLPETKQGCKHCDGQGFKYAVYDNSLTVWGGKGRWGHDYLTICKQCHGSGEHHE